MSKRVSGSDRWERNTCARPASDKPRSKANRILATPITPRRLHSSHITPIPSTKIHSGRHNFHKLIKWCQSFRTFSLTPIPVVNARAPPPLNAIPVDSLDSISSSPNSGQGSALCRSCHACVYEWWRGKRKNKSILNHQNRQYATPSLNLYPTHLNQTIAICTGKYIQVG